jgi:hypothetical protein
MAQRQPFTVVTALWLPEVLLWWVGKLLFVQHHGSAPALHNGDTALWLPRVRLLLWWVGKLLFVQHHGSAPDLHNGDGTVAAGGLEVLLWWVGI